MASVEARPRSVTSVWATGLSAVVLVGLMIHMTAGGYTPMTSLVACLLVIVAVNGVHDIVRLQVHRRPEAGLDRAGGDALPGAVRRIAVKLAGLWFTLALVALAYWVFPEYRKDLYQPYFHFLEILAPIFVIGVIPYFIFVDRRMRDPHDGYWLAGRLMLGNLPETAEQTERLKQHFMGWTIKAFFLPLMVSFLYRVLIWMSGHAASAQGWLPVSVQWWIELAFFLDLAFACVGYLLTMRVFDAHIRSSNPLVLGWLAALVCYEPFWGLVESQYLRYAWSTSWDYWLAESPVLYAVWGAVLVAAVLVYAWATVIFGLRFSNLTHRGIITGGPYAFTKHPAYISKNLFWWMTAMPFLSAGGWELAVKGCVLLGLVNAIYLVRARTEERHLSEDPAYLDYAAWIREHGAIARLRRSLGNGARRATRFASFL